MQTNNVYLCVAGWMATLVIVSVEDVTAREISRLHGGEYEDDIASCSLLKYTDA
jgi:hypothetical protein